MLKLIIKNLWSRRRSNGWLFAELIIVTILTWIILDQAVVNLHDINSPLGYEADRIVNINMEVIPSGSPEFDMTGLLPEYGEQYYNNLIAKARDLPNVESVISEYSGINGISFMSGTLYTGVEAIDSVAPWVIMKDMSHDSKLLSTYGIQTTDDSPSVKELESRPLGENEMIITESIDRYYWPDQRGIHDKYFMKPFSRDSSRIKVVGIVKDFRFLSFVRTPAVAISGKAPYSGRFRNRTTLILRLDEGIDTDEYVRNNIDRITKDLRIGNYYVRSVSSQKQQISEREYSVGASSKRNLMLFVALLFLINLIVGVTGCVWLQTGKRIPELGVLRSFGALKSQAIKMLICESVLLATVAYLIGVFIYFQYALANGLAIGFEDNFKYLPDNSWVNNFGEHFALISLIVYVVIIACVIIGTYFPALHVSRVEPVDALRDE